MKINFTFIFLISCISICFAQNNVIQGQIVDGLTGEPLSFCSIGWLNLNKGTVAGPQGKFKLESISEQTNPTLKISKIGYKPLNILWSEIKEHCILGDCPMVFELTPDSVELPEFVLESEGENAYRNWGKTSRKSMFGLAYNPKSRKPEENLGREIGFEIDTKGKQVKLLSVKMGLSLLQFESAVFRINIYKVMNDEKFELIHTRDELIWTLKPNDTKEYEFDLESMNILLQDRHLIGIEWIAYEKIIEDGIISMTTGFPFGKSFLKKSSHDGWEEVKGAPSIQVSGMILN
ncbi:MAG: carboxypeptidase-like regulatory domain-containing protein [Mongoliibacter sp.]|uniref:carboxypeptidase-like regulatory domain-containing protein n=1 Tax=Mongoliibacter sp. TaxID=2022438 RepID=UPI0012F1F845|nr:carboxypeptidase-like regulatory domain-containing protein [Mongoliibacter sp.]TVP50658.1 MAG: carboxypeptidase-like regulatory domain-containing protein [Mongoliibacter sp.]